MIGLPKTTLPNYEEVRRQRKWWILNAEGVPLGRVAQTAARLLMGKHKPYWVPFWDVGDGVIIINASRALLTGEKAEKEMFRWHSGRPGGLKEIPLGEMLQRNPRRVFKKVVWGMLPKNRLGKKMLKRLRVYAGPEHPHHAQKPEYYPLKEVSR